MIRFVNLADRFAFLNEGARHFITGRQRQTWRSGPDFLQEWGDSAVLLRDKCLALIPAAWWQAETEHPFVVEIRRMQRFVGAPMAMAFDFRACAHRAIEERECICAGPGDCVACLAADFLQTEPEGPSDAVASLDPADSPRSEIVAALAGPREMRIPLTPAQVRCLREMSRFDGMGTVLNRWALRLLGTQWEGFCAAMDNGREAEWAPPPPERQRTAKGDEGGPAQ